ncbi:MAG: cyanophycinase [Flammeovirgaceae bacterium]
MNVPKGKLIAIGGSEDKSIFLDDSEDNYHKLDFYEAGVLRSVLSQMKGVASHVEVITTATSMPYEVGEDYVRAFKELGCQINLLHIREREHTRDSGYLKRLQEADGVLFTGGDQLKIIDVFSGTEALEILKHRYQYDNFVIAGTSAGSMAMSEIMIEGGTSGNRSLMKGVVRIGKGLGFIKSIIIDSHFMKRGRFGRLTKTVAMHPECVGVGLGEDTGAIISGDGELSVIGSGHVVIIDGKDSVCNDIQETKYGMPFTIAGLKVHVLARNYQYNINKREFIPATQTVQ